MAQESFVVIPGTQRRVFDGSVVMLHRLPNLRWIIHYGYYNYGGKKQKGWYFSSIPADTVMPVFPDDLVALTVIDGTAESDGPVPGPYPPAPGPGPMPPGPHPPFPPGPPAPIPIPYTPQDKAQVESSMITVDDLAERDKMSNDGLQNGKIVRVNDTDGKGTVEYYSWDSATSTWKEASLGYRYMTREEITQAIASDIVEIVWSNENGALVITNNAGSKVDPIQLLGVAHDPIYIREDLQIRIPVYGRKDVIIDIPADNYLRSIESVESYEFEDGHVAPAVVVTVSDGADIKEFAADATPLRNIFTDKETPTIKIFIDTDNGHVVADVKISAIKNNPLKVDNEGLWVDLSGVVEKKEIESGLLLVADGKGEFTYGGNGVELETITAISKLKDPEKKVVTANLIADAISAAVSALKMTLEQKIDDLAGRVKNLEDKVGIGDGKDGELISSSGDGLQRSSYSIGGGTLDTASKNTVATEEALTKALSWHNI